MGQLSFRLILFFCCIQFVFSQDTLYIYKAKGMSLLEIGEKQSTLKKGALIRNKDVVKISGRQILVNEAPYVIKGVCYHPVPKGSDQRSFDNLTEDLALMVEAGINTIRVYAPIDDKAVLDEINDIII